MKNRILLLLIVSGCLEGYNTLAQSGLMTPDFVQVSFVTSIPACTVADKGKMFYYTSTNQLIYCNGTINSIINGSASPFSIPYVTSGNTVGDVLTISNNGSGRALVVNGPLKFTGNGESGGAMLMTDASGNATWNRSVAFRVNAGFINTSAIAHNTNTFLNLNNGISAEPNFDEGNDYDDPNNRFKAPVTGVYHFDVSLKWGVESNASNFVSTSLMKCDANGVNCVAIVRNKENNKYAPTQAFGVDVFLNANETIRVVVSQTQGGSSRDYMGTNSHATYLSGYLLR